MVDLHSIASITKTAKEQASSFLVRSELACIATIALAVVATSVSCAHRSLEDSRQAIQLRRASGAGEATIYLPTGFLPVPQHRLLSSHCEALSTMLLMQSLTCARAGSVRKGLPDFLQCDAIQGRRSAPELLPRRSASFGGKSPDPWSGPN